MDTRKFFDLTSDREPAQPDEVSHEEYTAIVFRLAKFTQDQLLGLQEEVDLELNYRENMTSPDGDIDDEST